MLDAVSELKLLNYGSLIPAEFWPDHFTRLMDEDQHRPWWELKSGDVGGEGNENEFTLTPLDLLILRDEEAFHLQLSEYYGELLRQDEADRELEYLLEKLDAEQRFFDRQGFPECFLFSCHHPILADAVVNEEWTPFICPDEEEDFVDFEDVDVSVSFCGGNIIKLGHKHDRKFDSHGRRGRELPSRHISRYTIRGRYCMAP